MTQIQHTFICCSHRTVQGICSMLGSEQGCFCSMLSLRNWTSIVSAVLSVAQGHTLLTLCCREHSHMPTPNRVGMQAEGWKYNILVCPGVCVDSLCHAGYFYFYCLLSFFFVLHTTIWRLFITSMDKILITVFNVSRYSIEQIV